MNKNDLIRREDVLARKEVITEEFHEHGASMSISHSVVTVDNINAVPAIEQPMSAVEYERARVRRLKWCNSRPCYSCNYYADCNIANDETPEYKVALVEKWAQKHPERSEECI